MKRIAVYCDGTWNRADAAFPTNVARLAGATPLRAKDGIAQHPVYIPGVGTGTGRTRLSRWIDKVGGGAFGWGLNRNIMAAYRQIAAIYDPGDEIYLFGFSRGAYTARSLGGMIRSCGIPPRTINDGVRRAMRRYRSGAKNTHPDHEDSFAFRLRFSPDVTTSDKERDWRDEHGHTLGQALYITYLGVWDTVGALGVPASIRPLAMLFNGRHQFHDHALSRSVRTARHAVAVDERRRTFAPTLWDNLKELQGEPDLGAASYLQEWFPGVHGAVGGGGDIVGLSHAAALWVARGAQVMGLELRRDAVDELAAGIDFTAPLDNSTKPPGFFTRLLRKSARDRLGPDRSKDVAGPTRLRWRNDLSYRPRTLHRVADDLNTLVPPGQG